LPSRIRAVTTVLSIRDDGPVRGREQCRLREIDLGAGDVDSAQLHPAEVRPAQVGALQHGVLEPRADQVGAAQVGPGQVGAGQVGLAQPDGAQLGRGQVLPAQRHETPIAAVHGQRPQVAVDEAAAGELAPGQRGVEEVAALQRRLHDRHPFQRGRVEADVAERAVGEDAAGQPRL
jgi:hypothetical protein